MKVRSSLVQRLPLYVGLLLATAGCELIANVDSSDIPQGGAGTGADGGAGGTGAVGGTGGDGGSDTCVAEDCSAGPCQVGVCDGDTCATELDEEGAPCTDDGGQICDAAGDCVECLTATECDGTDFCVGGMCVPELCLNGVMDGDETDVDCGGLACAPCENGLDCVEFGDCESGFCDTLVCTACAGDGDCQSGDYCDTNNECSPKIPIGDPCGANNECANGSCTDGVCCSSVCGGTCEACDIGGSLGICTPHAAGTDPETECTTDSDSCNGAGLCHCSDGINSVDETGVDCGGPTCGTCGLGEACVMPSDCASNACQGNLCVNASCGDGIVNGTDECDGDGAGNPGETATCDADCTFVVCGDGVFNTIAEACDDGGTDPCGPCNPACDGVGTGSTCGDGVVCPDSETGEEVIPGNDACGVYNATCDGPGTGSTCGDGAVCPDTETGEEAIPGNDACGVFNTTCDGAGTGSTCGDGIVCPDTETGEEAFPGNDACGLFNATCNGAGLGSVCGDGIVCPDTEAGEEAFPGTNACGAFNATCTGAGTGSTCGDGVVCPDTETGEEAFPGNNACGVLNATCNGAGTGSTCGDGVVCPDTETGEEAFPGNNACGVFNATCNGPGVASVCGDGVVCADTETGEEAFPGNDACGVFNATCNGAGTGSTCGDGIVCTDTETGEEAFPGNDACGVYNATCNGAGVASVCGDGVVCLDTETGEEAIPGNNACGVYNATCNGAGTGSVCSDGILCPDTEECDDDNDNNNDDCPDGAGGTCLFADCGDGFLHDQGAGDESDVDCGGMTCGGCDPGEMCNTGADCLSGSCDTGVCAPIAVVTINEVNANITSGCDLIELRVISGGTMLDTIVEERGATLVTFTDFIVATNEYIVVHLDNADLNCNSLGSISETTSVTEQANASFPENYDTAYDWYSTDTGLFNTTDVLTVLDQNSVMQDAVLLTDDILGLTAAADSETEAAVVAGLGEWLDLLGGLPAGGFVDADFNANAAADLDATGTAAAGDSIQRNDDVDANMADDWTQVVSTFGLNNVGQVDL